MRQFIGVCVGLGLLAGCGGNPNKAGVISGTITYEGKPVNGAALLLYPAAPPSGQKKDPITIPVDQEGAFVISDIPQGDYKVVVEGTAGAQQVSPASMKHLPPEKMEEAKKMLARMNTPATIKFPDKYKKVETTTLKVSVTDKDQTLELKL